MPRLTEAERAWVMLPTGDRLHAPDPVWHDGDDALTMRVMCGWAYDLLDEHVQTGGVHTDRPRCIRCCRITGIPQGVGPPGDDPAAAWKLGIREVAPPAG